MNPKTWNEFMEAMLEKFPQAEVDEDNYGQLIIYTNLKCNDDDTVVEMTDQDFV